MITLTAAVIALLGAFLLLAGGYLTWLGGSWFYLACGAGLLLAACGIYQRRNWGRLVYLGVLVLTLIWAVIETGFSWWPMASRLGLLIVLGLWLVSPWMERHFQAAATARLRLNYGLAGVVVAVGLITFASTLKSTAIVTGVVADTVNPSADLGPEMPVGEWHAYGGNNYGQRYSLLAQITTDNVQHLAVAWQIQTGDVRLETDVTETTYEATSLKVGDTLYLCTPHNWAMALNADTGETRWKFVPNVGVDQQRQHQTCRGLALYQPASVTEGQCQQQLFLPTSDAKLYALDAQTGELCTDFAERGQLDLLHNMPFQQSGYYYSTSPPLVVGDTVIVAGAVNDNYDINSPSGVIRAYHAKTGQLLWNWDSGHPFDTSPLDPNDPSQTYAVSSPNSWAVASADEQLGLAYFSMGNRTPDQLGSYRNESEEKYASSVVALDIKTGEAKWVQQFVHHDLWDMDTPSQPSLLDLDTAEGKQPALVVPTKQGDVYVLNRETGAPILPITEHPAPKGLMVQDEFTAETQPASALTFNPPELTESDMWGGTLIDQLLCRIQFKQLNYQGRYTPPSEQGTIVYPGNFGVFNWGSVAVDPKRQIMFGMPLRLAFISRMVHKDNLDHSTEFNTGEQGVNFNQGADYAVELKPFLSPLGVPCQQPPWGTIAAADLVTGKTIYQYVNGSVRDLTPLPLDFEMGVPGIGGPIITAGNLAFLAATVENSFKAYDLVSGEVLWKTRLPAGGQATPMTYLNSQGEQMVVLVVGGHGSIGTQAGDYVIAYKLKP